MKPIVSGGAATACWAGIPSGSNPTMPPATKSAAIRDPIPLLNPAAIPAATLLTSERSLTMPLYRPAHVSHSFRALGLYVTWMLEAAARVEFRQRSGILTADDRNHGRKADAARRDRRARAGRDRPPRRRRRLDLGRARRSADERCARPGAPARAGRAPAPLWTVVRGQGQHRRGRPAHDGR